MSTKPISQMDSYEKTVFTLEKLSSENAALKARVAELEQALLDAGASLTDLHAKQQIRKALGATK